MPGFVDVEAILSDLPEVTVGERFRHRTWFVNGKAFAWERPLSKADIKRWGDAPLPEGEILAVSTGDLGEKEAVLAARSKGLFTMAHFDGYPAVLVELRLVGKRVLRALLVDGWLATAPEALADEFLKRSRSRRR